MVNAQVEIIRAGADASTWTVEHGLTPGTPTTVYSGRGRVSYDLDRPATKDNADQITSAALVLVALPRDVDTRIDPRPGDSVRASILDQNGMPEEPALVLQVFAVRRSGLSWGITMDCYETRGRTNG